MAFKRLGEADASSCLGVPHALFHWMAPALYSHFGHCEIVLRAPSRPVGDRVPEDPRPGHTPQLVKTVYTIDRKSPVHTRTDDRPYYHSHSQADPETLWTVCSFTATPRELARLQDFLDAQVREYGWTYSGMILRWLWYGIGGQIVSPSGVPLGRCLGLACLHSQSVLHSSAFDGYSGLPLHSPHPRAQGPTEKGGLVLLRVGGCRSHLRSGVYRSQTRAPFLYPRPFVSCAAKAFASTTRMVVTMYEYPSLYIEIYAILWNGKCVRIRAGPRALEIPGSGSTALFETGSCRQYGCGGGTKTQMASLGPGDW